MWCGCVQVVGDLERGLQAEMNAKAAGRKRARDAKSEAEGGAVTMAPHTGAYGSAEDMEVEEDDKKRTKRDTDVANADLNELSDDEDEDENEDEDEDEEDLHAGEPGAPAEEAGTSGRGGDGGKAGKGGKGKDGKAPAHL